MRATSLLALLAWPVYARADYNTVLSDIDSISTLVDSFSTSVSGVADGIPGLPFALQVQVDGTNLDKRILQGTKDANASSGFGTIGSLQVGLALIGLQPKISSALSTLGDKSAAFGELGIVVLASLLQLKRDTAAFAAAVVPKLDALEAAIAPSIVDSINDSFDKAITVYQSAA